ncbi:hypothetical protein KP509_04G055200 [Ceratopteris richardii]|uniref:Uncharacterized protein n=1 Tax=Ceratopteris richardii TaxID=49495 RepID=A0A8T2UX52_CERRI|nr:hypothetical protein KP509_04G055200 [Ceratopteris richardii]
MAYSKIQVRFALTKMCLTCADGDVFSFSEISKPIDREYSEDCTIVRAHDTMLAHMRREQSVISSQYKSSQNYTTDDVFATESYVVVRIHKVVHRKHRVSCLFT